MMIATFQSATLTLSFIMHPIAGTLHSVPLPWPPLLANIEPPTLRRKDVVDNLIKKTL